MTKQELHKRVDDLDCLGDNADAIKDLMKSYIDNADTNARYEGFQEGLAAGINNFVQASDMINNSLFSTFKHKAQVGA